MVSNNSPTTQPQQGSCSVLGWGLGGANTFLWVSRGCLAPSPGFKSWTKPQLQAVHPPREHLHLPKRPKGRSGWVSSTAAPRALGLQGYSDILEAAAEAVTPQCCLTPAFPSRWSINYARLVLMVPGPGLGVPTVSPRLQAGLGWHCQLCPSQGNPAAPGLGWVSTEPSPSCAKRGPGSWFVLKTQKKREIKSAVTLGRPPPAWEDVQEHPWGCRSQLGPSLWVDFVLPHFGTDGKRNSPFPPNDFHLQTAHCP